MNINPKFGFKPSLLSCISLCIISLSLGCKEMESLASYLDEQNASAQSEDNSTDTCTSSSVETVPSEKNQVLFSAGVGTGGIRVSSGRQSKTFIALLVW